MHIDRALRRGRRATEARMRATCEVTRPGEWVSDGTGGGDYESTDVYRGPCYTRYPGLAFEQTFDVAGGNVVASRLVVRIPFGPMFRPGDTVRITADPDNPQMVGTLLSVASIDDQSQATAQRLLCVDYQGGVYTGAGATPDE